MKHFNLCILVVKYKSLGKKYNPLMYIFVHHSDLRIADNTTINYLIEHGIEFQPIFIGTPDQLEKSNTFKSDNAIHFMVESLADLTAEYKKCGKSLFFYYGNTTRVLEHLLIENQTVDGIANNRDYSPYAVERDNDVAKLAHKHGVSYILLEDALLNPVENVLTGQGREYTKFTPYFNNAHKFAVPVPRDLSSKLKKHNPQTKLKKSPFDTTLEFIRSKARNVSPSVEIRGGRSAGLKILTKISQFDDYNEERNTPIIPTTRLSAYMKFGCVSSREAFYAVRDELGAKNELVKQLYWRDFYHMILHYYGSFDTPVSITKDTFNGIQWVDDEDALQRWKDGMTGCPIVDAGMREMNATGFMHNRLRMIVASYLIFYLRLDWREGMLYFSQKLVDADWANNVGNWQWTAGVEKWSNDYYRVFSMESQAERFDPECVYIKKWIPELSKIPASDIIEWDTQYTKYAGSTQYPEPIIDNNKLARQKGIEMYKKALKT
jgi:deoxyribodipyrimidine photo-lyase